MRFADDDESELTQRFVWELSSDGYQDLVVFKLCYKRNQSDCERTTVANSSSLPLYNVMSPSHRMSHSISISDDGEYVISVVAQSGNMSAESNIINFKKGLYKILMTAFLQCFRNLCNLCKTAANNG